jgi:ParB-like chromosome segregation protein Spo0J
MAAKLAKQRYVAAYAIEKLKFDPKNAKKHAKQTISDSIRANDFYGAALAQEKTGLVLAGHGRIAGAKRTGIKEVPVIFIDVPDAVARRILAVDNGSTLEEGFDEAKLAALLEEIRDEGGLYGTGYDEADLDELLKSAGADDDDDAKETKPKLTAGLDYKIIVECKGEADQAEILAMLEADGYTCRPIIA